MGSSGSYRFVEHRRYLDGLIDQLDLTGKRLAVEVNEEVVPRSEHGEFRLRDGDRVEIVHAIGGG